MSTVNKIWESSHEIPDNAFIPAGTDLAQYDGDVGELTIYTTTDEGPWYGSPEIAPVRSIEPLPDPDDTGDLFVETLLKQVQLLDTESGGIYPLTYQQTKNLIRKLQEAVNGN